MTLADRLAELYRRATPGRWINGERVRHCQEVNVEHADICVEQSSEECENIACATFSPQDADLIVDLHNVWPAIERVLRAAEAWRAARNRSGTYFVEADELEQALVAMEEPSALTRCSGGLKNEQQ